MSERDERIKAWREHNDGFRYTGPDKPAEAWSQEEREEVHDRVIGRRVEWTCQKCSQPFSSLKRARRHVASNHGQHLEERYGDDDE